MKGPYQGGEKGLSGGQREIYQGGRGLSGGGYPLLVKDGEKGIFSVWYENLVKRLIKTINIKQ